MPHNQAQQANNKAKQNKKSIVLTLYVRTEAYEVVRVGVVSMGQMN